MKGTLHKTEKGWMVSRCVGDGVAEVWEETLPLHPDFIELMDTCFTSKFIQEVEFEIVTEWENGEVGINGLTYAKLTNHIVDTNEMVDQVPDVRKMVEDDVWEVGLQDELNKLPYTKHLDDGQYNDGQLAGFELGSTWGYNKAKETLYTEEQVMEAISKSVSILVGQEINLAQLKELTIQLLKQPKKD